MRRAIPDLVQLSDERLFEEVSKGVAHIVAYATHLDALARNLISNNEHRGATIIRALAKEEAAKVLILVDAVRCPPTETRRQSAILSGFYNHLTKHIYAEASWWRSADFADVKRAVDRERVPYYLDGPNDVDWIFRNAAHDRRERSIYVDYVRDITEEGGEYEWISPMTANVLWRSPELAPTSLVLAQAMHGLGVTTPSGLRIVADVWRPFRPEPNTRSVELFQKIRETLSLVLKMGLASEQDPAPLTGTVVQHWPFPLWSLDLTQAASPSRADLRDARSEHIRDLVEIEVQRDPALRIARRTVEALSGVYDDWMLEHQRWAESLPDSAGNLRIVPSERPPFESEARLRRLVQELTLEERMDLAALGWFGRERSMGWTYLHAHARRIIGDDIGYECGLGAYWLRGLSRWESPPEMPTSLRSSGEAP